MKLEGGVDRLDLFGLHGWAADRDQPDVAVEVEIVKNGERIATAPAAVFRADLAAAGLGTGRHAFWLDPFEWLEYGENRLEIRFAGTEAPLPNGARTIYFDAGLVQRFRAGGPVARPAGYRRDAIGAEAFLGEVVHRLGPAGLEGRHVLEVAPGEGALLAAVRARGIRYASYVGLETSAARAGQLVRRFGDRKTRFVHGSLAPDTAAPGPDVVLGFAGIDRLFPSFVPAVLDIRGRLAPGTPLYLGFPLVDAELLVSAAWVEDAATGGDFVRVYSGAELERMLGRCGLDVEALAAVGPAAEAQVIFACARNTSRSAAPLAAPETTPPSPEPAGPSTWLSRALLAPRLQPARRRLDRWGVIPMVRWAVAAVRPGRSRHAGPAGPVR